MLAHAAHPRIAIRPATALDVPRLVVINHAAYPELVAENVVWSASQLHEHLARFARGQLVAELDGNVMGRSPRSSSPGRATSSPSTHGSTSPTTAPSRAMTRQAIRCTLRMCTSTRRPGARASDTRFMARSGASPARSAFAASSRAAASGATTSTRSHRRPRSMSGASCGARSATACSTRSSGRLRRSGHPRRLPARPEEPRLRDVARVGALKEPSATLVFRRLPARRRPRY